MFARKTSQLATKATPAAFQVARSTLSTSALAASEDNERDPRLDEERFGEDYDVVVVGGGPSGLATAIRFKQLCESRGKDYNLVLVEKGAEIGAHILSGACIETRALDELIPDWQDRGAPLHTKGQVDKFTWMLSETTAVPLPVPPQMHNEDNYIVSLGNVCRWLGDQAEALGVDIFPGIAASEVLYKDGYVNGVATNDVGIDKAGKPKPTFERGMELRAKMTVFSEGCRGHLTKTLWDKYDLRKNAQPQTYGIGIKELWEIDPEKHRPGYIEHTVGWPLDFSTYGGSWMYHYDENLVSIGFVIGLDYKNPYLNPYREFQRFKHHPQIKKHLEGGRVISYGARAISEGGLQSIPQVAFPGGVLTGDTAGFLNTPKIKGTHNAMKSGILAAEAIFDALEKAEQTGSEQLMADTYQERLQSSWLWEDLSQARNIRPAFQYGFFAGIGYSAIDTYLLRGKAPWTLSYNHWDNEATEEASKHTPIEYPKPDGKISFDLLTNLTRSGTNHDHDQPAHLTLKDQDVPVNINYKKYAGLENRFCPAGVYEYVPKDGAPENPGPEHMRLQINAQNCVHCKTCDIKDPTQNINWVNPQGGEGPAYGSM